MRFSYSEDCLDHNTGVRHPESPDRLRAIRQGLKERHRVEYVDAPAADRPAITAVHDAGYVDEVERFCVDGGGNWDPDTVASAGTYDAARKSAGLAMWAAAAALAGEDGRDTPFSLGRPPGHHAVAGDAMGFCFFNNAAVAAQAALDGRLPHGDDSVAGEADLDAVDRVAVFDWDVHHGNGTQDIFYDRGDVLYASIHEAGLYPGTGEVAETGEGNGERATLNAALSAGAGDAEYLHIVDEAVAPALERFDPDLLVVSAGFDAHRHDPISRMRVSSEGYARLTDRMRAVADDVGAALAFVLEGGYGLDTLSEGVGIVHETFDGRQPLDLDDPPDEEARDQAAELRDRLGL